MNTNVTYVNESRPRERLADTFLALAMIVLNTLQDGVCMVCGPITTGGMGGAELNVTRLKTTIAQLRNDGIVIFDNTMYEPTLWSLKDEWELANGKTNYCMPILEQFYDTIYRSGKIKRAYFLSGWESSFGCNWERTRFNELGIEIVDL